MASDRVGSEKGDAPAASALDSANAYRSDTDWRHVLRKGVPSDIIARLTNGDPLELTRRCAIRARARAHLVDLDRLVHRTIAHLGIVGPIYDGEPPLDAWLDECIDHAIDQLLREDTLEEREGRTAIDSWDARYSFLTLMVAVPPRFTRRACVTFNSLAPENRLAFFKLVIECESVEECLAAGMGPPETLRGRCMSGIRALLDLGDDGPSGSNVPKQEEALDD